MLQFIREVLVSKITGGVSENDSAEPTVKKELKAKKQSLLEDWRIQPQQVPLISKLCMIVGKIAAPAEKEEEGRTEQNVLEVGMHGAHGILHETREDIENERLENPTTGNPSRSEAKVESKVNHRVKCPVVEFSLAQEECEILDEVKIFDENLGDPVGAHVMVMEEVLELS